MLKPLAHIVALSLLPAAVVVAQQPPVSVRAEPVERKSLELTRPLVASIEPVTTTTLAAEQGGFVTERLFDEGQVLKEGEVLVRLDTDLLKIERDAARAAADALAAQVQQAEALAENAQREERRMKKLIEQQAAPEKEYFDAMTQARTTAAILSGRKAELAEKRADVARFELMIKKSELRPLRGNSVVAKRHVEVGQWLKQGDPVADLVWLDPVFVRANVPEQVIAKVKKGDTVRVTVDALGGKTLEGKVDQILPTADPASRTFPVKVLLANPDGAIRPGFFAMATFLSSSGEGQFLVPRDAVLSREGKSRVIVVRDGKAIVVPVERGASQGDRVVVSGELTDKDRVVTRGNEALQGGEPLQVHGDPPPGAPAAQAAP